MNAYQMSLRARENVGEKEPERWVAVEILAKLNSAQRRIGQYLSTSPGDWLVVSDDFTPVNSVITLSSDVAKPVYMEEKSTGYAIPFSTTIRDRRLTLPVGASLGENIHEAYFLQNQIVVNAVGYATEVTLWYEQRIKDMHFGIAGDGSEATAIEFPLDMEPSVDDDAYNTLKIETVGSRLSDTITDYDASTRIATITGTPTAGEYYGTVSQLLKESHDLIVLMATVSCLAKGGASIDEKQFEFFLAEERSAKRDFENWVSTRKSGSNRTRITGMGD